MNDALRTAIREITEASPIAEHAQRLARLEFTHTIRVLDSAVPLESYTCGVHAFHLVGHPTYEDVASFGLGRVFAGKNFVESILRLGKLIPVQEPDTKADDIVVYFEGEVFCHVGRLCAPGRVVSKWGTGLLVEHALWEVPATYGRRVAFFRGLSAEESFESFLHYARECGFKFGGK